MDTAPALRAPVPPPVEVTTHAPLGRGRAPRPLTVGVGHPPVSKDGCAAHATPAMWRALPSGEAHLVHADGCTPCHG